MANIDTETFAMDGAYSSHSQRDTDRIIRKATKVLEELYEDSPEVDKFAACLDAARHLEGCGKRKEPVNWASEYRCALILALTNNPITLGY